MIIQPITDLVKQSTMRAFNRAGLVLDTRSTLCPKCKASFNGEPSKCAAHVALCKYTRNLRETMNDKDTTFCGESLYEGQSRWQGNHKAITFDSDTLLSYYGTPVERGMSC